MSHPFWYGLNDEQHATVQSMIARVEQLEQEANRAAALRDDAENIITDLREGFKEARAKMEADYQTVCAAVGEAAANAERDRERLTLTARVLVPVLVDWLDALSAFEDLALVPAVRQRRKDAVELMRTLTPFTS